MWCFAYTVCFCNPAFSYWLHVAMAAVQLWPDLQKGAISCILKCAYFKEAYFCNAMHNPNQIGVLWRRRCCCSGAEMKSYDCTIRVFRDRVHGICDRRKFFKKWHHHKGAYLRNGGSSGLLVWDGISWRFCTKNYFAAINSCGIWQFENCQKFWENVGYGPFLQTLTLHYCHSSCASMIRLPW